MTAKRDGTAHVPALHGDDIFASLPVAALLVDPGDTGAIAAALHRVVEDQEFAADLKDRGLKRAQDLRWEDFAKANLALYRRVLASP